MKYLMLVIFFLQGCATTFNSKLEKSVDDDFEYGNQLKKGGFIAEKVVDNDDMYFDTKTIVHKIEYPPSFYTDLLINKSTIPVSIDYIADYIFKKTGVVVRISEDAHEFQLYDGSVKLSKGFFYIDFEGDIVGLLDYITSKCGLSWSLINNEVNIFKHDTKTWFISGFAGSTKNNSSISSSIASSGSGAQGGFSNQSQSGHNSAFSSDFDILSNISDTVKSFVSKTGTVFLSQGTSSITVTDKPIVLNRIDSYIKMLNKRISTNINFEISIFNVSKDDTQNKSFSLNVVWDNIRQYNSTLNLFGSSEQQASSLGVDVNDVNSQFFGSKYVASLFNKYGKVTIVENINLSTLPNQAVPFQYANEKGYIKEVSTTIVSNAGATTNITQGNATTGIDLKILPVLAEDGYLLVQFSMIQSSLRSIQSFESGGFKVQQPDTDVRNFVERVHVKSGELIVLAGYDQKISRVNTQSPFGKKAWFLGGSKTGESRKTMLVVVIRPIIHRR